MSENNQRSSSWAKVGLGVAAAAGAALAYVYFNSQSEQQQGNTHRQAPRHTTYRTSERQEQRHQPRKPSRGYETQCFCYLDENGPADCFAKTCGHRFHRQCIQDLYINSNGAVIQPCPICRVEFNTALDFNTIKL